MLTMGGGALQQLADCKRVHGVITTFRRVNRSEDQSTYQITLQPFLSLLDKQFRSHRFFVNKSVPEVVEQVLQEHHLHDWEYEFNLKQHSNRANNAINTMENVKSWSSESERNRLFGESYFLRAMACLLYTSFSDTSVPHLVEAKNFSNPSLRNVHAGQCPQPSPGIPL